MTVTGTLVSSTKFQKPKLFNSNFKRNTYKKLCIYCQGEHFSDQCSKFPTLVTRKKQRKENFIICLKSGHSLKNFWSNWRTCLYCSQKGIHHRRLCPKHFPSSTRNTAELTNTTINYVLRKDNLNHVERSKSTHSVLAVGETVLMQTALGSVSNPNTNEQITSRVFLDCGSQRSYITENLCK